MSIIGLDLAGVEKRPTGYCLLKDLQTATSIMYSDKDIIDKVLQIKPAVVAIDAPLSLPPGRKTIEDRNGEHLRLSDRELLRRGIKFFPITLGPMRELTKRGIFLRSIFENSGLRVIEAYPGGAQDVLGIPRKQQGLEQVKAGLESLGLNGLKVDLSDHELDAATIAYVGKLFLEGKSVTYGPIDDGIVMPPGEKQKTLKTKKVRL
jgi:uncharacterized protein